VIKLLQLSSYPGDVAAPSPNHDARQAPAIEGIVLHASADQGEEVLSLGWLRSAKSGVSCHLFVARAGRVTRLVGDRQRAWHAGVSWWKGTSDVNSITLGIEIANRNDGEPYTDAQYRRVAAIVAHYCSQGLSLDDVVSHAQISSGRKTDPVDWDWLRFRALVREQLLPPQVAIPATPLPQSVHTIAVKSAPKPTGPVVAAALPKPVVQSRTIWLNAITALAAGGILTSDSLDLAHGVGIHVPEQVAKWALFVIGLVNIILRLRTSRPLRCTVTGECPPQPAIVWPNERRSRPRG